MRLLLMLLFGALLLLPGCPADDEDDATGDDDDTTAADDDDTTAAYPEDSGYDDDDDDSAFPAGAIGQITAVYWVEDALFPWPDLTLHAVFSPDPELTDVEDGVGRLSLSGVDVWAPDGYWELPAPDTIEPFTDTDLMIDPTSAVTWDGGPWVAAGDVLLAGHSDLVSEDIGVHVYEQDLEAGADAALLQSLDEPLDVEWTGGDDLPGLSLESALVVPLPPELTSVDASRPLPLRAGADLVLSWTPEDPESSIVVVAQGPEGGLVTRVDDSLGSVTLTWQDLAPFGGDPALSVARVRQSVLPVDGDSWVQVSGVTRQFLYGERVGAWSLDVPIWPVGTDVDVELAWWDAGFDLNTAFIDAGAGVLAGTFGLGDTLGQRLTSTVTIDAAAATGPRDLTAGDNTGSFTASEAAWIVAELPHAGLCEDAVDEGDVSDGAWLSTDGGLDDSPFDTSECSGSPTGRDQAVPVALQSGERLRARLRHQGAGGSLYLVGGCDDSNAAFPCVTEAVGAPEVELEYIATFPEDLLLVVDSWMPASSEPNEFVIDVRRDGPFPFVFDETFFTDGPHTDVYVYSTGADWTQGDVSFDLGPDITVTDVTVFGGSGDTAEIDFEVASGATIGPRSVSITTTALGTVTMPEAIDIGGFVYTGSCGGVTTPTVPGHYQGSTSFAAYGEVDGSACLPATDGSESLFRLDLGPGETLEATLTSDFDGVLYIVESCDPAALALTCADNTIDGAEYLSWVAPAAGGTVWLIVDGAGVSDEGEYEIELEVHP